MMARGGRSKKGGAGERRRLTTVGAAALSIAALLAASAAARGETLKEALASAYLNNPKLEAERARLRATDEDVARAESGFRPVVEGAADYGREKITTRPKSDSTGGENPWGYSISVRQSVFSGWRTTSQVAEAEASVKAGREALRQVESEVLLNAVTAYMDVVTAAAILRIRENNVAVLTEEVEAARTRRAAKEVTRTDVAQAEARRARAASTADLAKSDLKTARATFERIVGHAPGAVSLPPMRLKQLPASIEEAWQFAERQNPALGSALFREEAARHAVDKVRGELLPEVNIEANYGHRDNLSGGTDQEDAASITGRVSVPFYDGGEVRARVRQAKHVHVARLQEIEEARSETQEAVTAAWSALQGQRAKLKSDGIQMEANRIALEGVREEQRVGQRTLLDVLNAEQEFLDSQIELVNARRGVVITSYRLLSAIGMLTSETMGLTSTVYDPEEHFMETRQNWFGIDITRADGSTETYEAMDKEQDSEASAQ